MKKFDKWIIGLNTALATFFVIMTILLIALPNKSELIAIFIVGFAVWAILMLNVLYLSE